MTTIKSITLAAVILALLSTCRSDEETSLERVNRLLKSATWRVDKLTVDGVDQSSLYPEAIVTFSEGGYTSENAEPVWPATGTWRLENETTIVRDDGMIITIQTIEPTHLELFLMWNKNTFRGRPKSISGEHVFEMSPE